MSERVFQRKKNSEKHPSEKTSQRKYKTAKNKTTLTLTLTLTFISSPCFADLYFAQMFFAYFFFRCLLFAEKSSLKRLSLNCNHTTKLKSFGLVYLINVLDNFFRIMLLVISCVILRRRCFNKVTKPFFKHYKVTALNNFNLHKIHIYILE
jgi:hypothetical protein